MKNWKKLPKKCQNNSRLTLHFYYRYYFLLEFKLQILTYNLHLYLKKITPKTCVVGVKEWKEASMAISDITISTANGIILNKNPKAGRNIFEVNFEDQNLNENFPEHAVHLVKIADGAEIKTFEKWLNWMDPKGFIAPIPKGS